MKLPQDVFTLCCRLGIGSHRSRRRIPITITEARFREHIESLLPNRRGNVKVPNLQVLNAILHVAGNGCQWRGLPEDFGPRHTTACA